MGITGEADTRASFEIGDFPAGQTTIMDEMLANTAAGPPSTQHRVIAIQPFPADTTIFGFDAEKQGLPFSSSISNTHRGTVY